MSISLTALTILGSFGAASTAQIVSHVLTLKREDKKYQKECLQNLYSPIVFKLIDYLRMIGTSHSPIPYFKDDSVTFLDTERIFSEVMKGIGDNLKYANADLINIYHEIKGFGEHDDLELDKEHKEETEFNLAISDELLLNRILLANLFFSQYIEINRALKTSSKLINEKMIPPYFYTHMYLLVHEFYWAWDDTELILSLYDLIEHIILANENFVERINNIRKELYAIQYLSYKDSHRVTDAYLTSYQFLYEIADEISILSQERAEELQEFLDDNIHRF